MKKRLIVIIIMILLIFFSLLILFFNPFVILKLKGDSIVEVTINEEYKDEGVTAKVFNKDIKDINIHNDVDIKKLGTYEVKYSVKKLFTKKSVSRTVNVIDNVEPEISFTSEIKEVCPNNYKINNYKAVDNLDGDITSNVTVEKQDNYLVYKVKDSSNNELIVKKEVNFIDNEKPKISLKGEINYIQKLNTEYKEPGYNVSDNCDKDVKVEISGSVNVNKEGTYKLTYTAIDSSNNKLTLTRNVIVSKHISSEGHPSINGYGEDIEGPTYIKGILIVNKIYTLPKSYDPGVNKEALTALKSLQADGKALGFDLTLISGYRSYSTQKSIYERNIKNKGYNNTDYSSARPGHSEHQSGLAFDVGKLSESYGSTSEGKWLEENCHLYGFIIRYPKNKTNITGYSYEPWHIRYVGVEAAKEIYEKNITLEEFLGVKGTY